MAFERGDDNSIGEVLKIGGSSLELTRGIFSALGWIPLPQVQQHLQQFVLSESLTLRRIGLSGYALHRQDPGLALIDALNADDPLLKARALKAVGELGRRDLLPLVQRDLNTASEQCRYAAAWSGTFLGESAAVPVLQAVAESGGPNAERAIGVALRRMTFADAHAWQRYLAERLEATRLSIIAAGVMGDPGLIPWLIESMAIPDLARVAGEAFTVITGVDIAYDNLDGEKPADFEGGPTENPEDENVGLDPDEELPWPNPELIQKWWGNHQAEFQKGTRYLLGKPIRPDCLWDVLRNGYQRQRAAAALELALRQPGQPLFEVRAPGFRQQQLLRIHR
jgi:uncharacterized protein (TIGR02270 family)